MSIPWSQWQWLTIAKSEKNGLQQYLNLKPDEPDDDVNKW
jgi:hypothetical protein